MALADYDYTAHKYLRSVSTQLKQAHTKQPLILTVRKRAPPTEIATSTAVGNLWCLAACAGVSEGGRIVWISPFAFGSHFI